MPLNSKHVDSIEAHQQSIGIALQETSDRFRAIKHKLDKYKSKSKTSNGSNDTAEWIKQAMSIGSDQKVLTKKIKRAVEILGEDLSNDKGKGPSRASLLDFKKKVVITTRTSTSPSLKSVLHDLVIMAKELYEEQIFVENELLSITDALKNNHSNDEKQILPVELTKAIQSLTTQFGLILREEYMEGMGSALQDDLQILTESIATNFEKLNSSDGTKVESTTDNYHQKWDERSQLILRHTFKQWQKKRNANEKKSLLAKLAVETGFGLAECKIEWQKLELSTISKSRDKGLRILKKKDRELLLAIGLKDVEKMRQSIIQNIAKVPLAKLKDELSQENEYRLDLLRDLRGQIEARHMELLRNKQHLEKEEGLRLENRKQSDLLVNREKMRMYLEYKEKEIRIGQLEELKRLNDEEEARLKRIAINKRR